MIINIIMIKNMITNNLDLLDNRDMLAQMGFDVVTFEFISDQLQCLQALQLLFCRTA